MFVRQPSLPAAPTHCPPQLFATRPLPTCTFCCYHPLPTPTFCRHRCCQPPLSAPPPGLCRLSLSARPDLVSVVGNLNLGHQENAVGMCKKRKKICSYSTTSHTKWQGSTIPVRFVGILYPGYRGPPIMTKQIWI
jgi:hypothetical protein